MARVSGRSGGGAGSAGSRGSTSNRGCVGFLNIKKGLGSVKTCSQGQELGTEALNHSLLQYSPGVGLTLGRHQGDGISQTLQVQTVAGQVCCQLASKAQVRVPFLPVPLTLDKLFNFSDALFSHL